MQLVTVDFDGTLYQGDSFKLMFKAGKKEFGIKEWLTIIIGSLQAIILGIFKGKNRLRIHFFNTFAKTFKGKTEAELSSFFHHLIVEGEADINQDLVKKIHEHQNNGNQVMILSGALRPFLEALTDRIGLDVTIVGTGLAFDKQGRCTGATTNIINGEKKVEAVKEWFKKNNVSHADTKVWAYADSESDIPLLHFVDYPIIVNPKDKMKEVATANNWPIFNEK
ncbi:HAD family hydrolase [Oceanobacillus sp. CAU 1775]